VLLISGASVNLENLQGQTPLHVAVEHDMHHLMELFISFNAHLDAEVFVFFFYELMEIFFL
jgi:ankyrin repeat protein